MGILGRINRLVRSNVNDLLDKLSDPGKEIDLLVVELEENARRARHELVSCAAAVKLAETRCHELEGNAELWERRAGQALRADDEALAREALQRKLSLEADLTAARKTLEEQRAYADELRTSLAQLDNKVREISSRKETLKAQARAARQGGSPLKPGGAFAELDRVEDRIEAFVAEAELDESLGGKDADIEARLSRLQPGDPQVEDALAELKRKVERGE